MEYVLQNVEIKLLKVNNNATMETFLIMMDALKIAKYKNAQKIVHAMVIIFP